MVFHSFIQYWENAFLKDFVLDEIGFILEAIPDLRG